MSDAGLNLGGLDRQSQQMLQRLEADPFLDPVNMSPDQMRAAFDAFYGKIDLGPADVDARDTVFQGPAGPLRVRIYRPKTAGDGPLPMVMFFKGGGLIMGSLDSYDSIARRVCQASSAIVISVDYRQPPENRYPAASDDCYAALVWAHDNAVGLGGDPSRMAVFGDSGGGMLACVVTHMALDGRGPKLAYQVLVYPAVGRGGESRSIDQFAKGYWFEPDALYWLYDQYVTDPAQVQDPAVSPVLRQDLTGLPPAYVVVANFDILRDDIDRYAERLRQAGTPVEVKRYEHTIHGFINMGGAIDYVGETLDLCGQKLAAAFASQAG